MSHNKVFNNTIPIRVSVANWDENTGGGDVEADISHINRNVAQVHNNGGGLVNSESTIHDRMTDSNLHLESIEENTRTIISKIQNNSDLTTVNSNTTDINNVLGDVSEGSTSGTINGRFQRNNELTERIATDVLNMHNAVGANTDNEGFSTIVGQLKQTNQTLGTVRSTTDSDDLFGKISTIRNYTENNNGKLIDIKNTTGDIKSTLGKVSDASTGTTISARLAAIKSATTSNYSVVDNLRNNIGFTNDASTENTVIGLLKGIKESGGSGTGADMTTVNTNTTAIKDTIGTSGDAQDTNTISGKLSALRGTNNTIALYSETIRNNLGVSSDSSSSNTVIGLLKRIIENN